MAESIKFIAVTHKFNNISVFNGVSDCCLMPNEQFISYLKTGTSYIQS